MSSQNRAIFDPLPPLSSLLLSRVYLVNRLWGYSTPYRDDIVYGWPLMQSSFSQNDEIPNSWQTYIVKRQEKETEKLTKFFFLKRQDLVAANFHPHYHFFQQLICTVPGIFFVQTTSGYYVFFWGHQKLKNLSIPDFDSPCKPLHYIQSYI